ncbi:MAG: hypothetical protein ACFN4L_06375 [Pauljensenia sp.]
MTEIAWDPRDAEILAGRIASQAADVRSLASTAKGAHVDSNCVGLMISPLVLPVAELFMGVIDQVISFAGTSCDDLHSDLNKVNSGFQEMESTNISEVQRNAQLLNGDMR